MTSDFVKGMFWAVLFVAILILVGVLLESDMPEIGTAMKCERVGETVVCVYE